MIRLLAIVAIAGCADPEPYACTADSQCRHHGDFGVCQPEGFCSFVDLTCESGQRFDETSDEAHATSCVDVVPQAACVQQLDLGETHSCVRARNGTLQCWGGNGSGQLGNSGMTSAPVAQTPTTGIMAASFVTAGEGFTCGIDGGVAECWGQDTSDGKLGDADGTTSPRPVPDKVVMVSDSIAHAISAGAGHACAIADSGTFCWGDNAGGKLGLGVDSINSPPALVAGGHVFDEIAAGGSHTCAREGGTVWCWGNGLRGQLGQGLLASSNMPVQVIDLPASVVAISVGQSHSCARTLEGELYCWGENGDGQLGVSATDLSDRRAPVRVAVDSVVGIATGDLFSCAIDATGSAFCWGGNFFGQLGETTNDPHPTPVSVVGLTDATAIAAGNAHVCARRRDDTVVCWGSNANGRTVIGDLTSELTTPTVANFHCPD